MSVDRAGQIRARLNAATAGPWRWAYPGSDSPELVGVGGDENYSYEKDVLRAEHDGGCACRQACKLEVLIDNDADAELIANAPADLAWLLDERDRLLAEVDSLTMLVRRDREGICAEPPPTLAGSVMNEQCVLRAGHSGWHEAESTHPGTPPMRWGTANQALRREKP